MRVGRIGRRTLFIPRGTQIVIIFFKKFSTNALYKFLLSITIFRYQLALVGNNRLPFNAELAVDDFSLSPHCFGLGISDKKAVGDWRANMTDIEYCLYYGKERSLSTQSLSTENGKTPSLHYILI